MRLHHFALTLSGSAQPITTDKSIVGSYVTLLGKDTNSDPIYIGGISDAVKTQTVSSSAYQMRVPAPDASGNGAPYPLDPWNKGIQLSLNDIWAIGTAAEVLMVGYWAK